MSERKCFHAEYTAGIEPGDNIRRCSDCQRHAAIRNKDGKWTCLRHATDPDPEQVPSNTINMWKLMQEERKSQKDI